MIENQVKNGQLCIQKLKVPFDTYMTRELQKRIQELEYALGRKQMKIDLLNMVIDLGILN